MRKEIFKQGQSPGAWKASDLQGMADNVQAVRQGLTVGDGLSILYTSQGPGIGLQLAETFIAVITEQDPYTGACAFTELAPLGSGQWETRINGRTGTTTESPAFELNGMLGMPTPFRAEVTAKYSYSHGAATDDGISGQEYSFKYTGGPGPEGSGIVSVEIIDPESLTCDGSGSAGDPFDYDSRYENYCNGWFIGISDEPWGTVL